MPKYKVNGEVYNIPDDAVAGFEKKYPDATVAYYDGGDKYNIPISMRGDFEKQYPNATTSAPTIKEQQPAPQPTSVEQPKPSVDSLNVEQPMAVLEPMKSDTIQPVQPIQSPKAKLVDNPDDYYPTLEQNTRKDVEVLSGDIDVLLNEAKGASARKYAEQTTEAAKGGFWKAIQNAMVNTAGAVELADAQAQTPQKIWGGGIDRDAEKEINDYKAAEHALENARRTINEADINAKNGTLREKMESTFVGGAARGFGQKLFDVRTWDMGVSDFKDQSAINDALDAAENGTLTESQEALLNAKAQEMAVQAYFGSYVGRGYKAGSVTAESLPFMLEMCINPASTLGKSAASRLARYAINKYGKQAAKKVGAKVLRAGARVAGDVAGAAAMTATTGSIRTAADAMERMSGGVAVDTDEQGHAVFDGRYETPEDVGTAIRKAFAAQTIQYGSEMLGHYFAPALNIISKPFGKIPLGRVQKFLDDVSASDFGKLVADFQKRAQWNGNLGEFAEEMSDGVLNALIVGDQTLDTDPETGVFNRDNLIDTYLGVNLLGFSMSSIKTVGYGVEKYQQKRAVKRADVAAADAFGSGDVWDKIKTEVDAASNEELPVLLGNILSNPDVTNDQKTALMVYVGAKQREKGAVIGEQKRRENPDVPQEQVEVEQSFDNGAALETPQEKNDAQNMFEYQQQQMRQYFGLGEDGDVDAFLGDDPIAGLQRVAANDQEAGQVVLDYLNAKATVDGVFQRMSDDAEAEIAEADAIIASRTNRNNGLIQRVRLKNDKQAYVLSGDIVMTDDGDMVNVSKSSESLVVIDAITGKKEYTYPSNIAEVYQSVDAEAERQTLHEQVIDEYSQKLADDMNGTLAFAPGDNYTLVDDQGAQHNVQIVADNGDGTVAVVEVMSDGVQQDAVMAKSTIQEMSDTHNQLRLGQYLQDKKAQEIAIAEQEKQAEQPEVVAEEQQQQPVSALSQVPKDKKGKHDFNQVSPDIAWSAIVEMTGGAVDDALDTAKQMQKQSNDALKAAQKEKPKVGTDVESIIANKNAHKEKINGLQAIADHWANIVALGEQSAQQNGQTEEVVAENVVAEETTPVAEQTEVTPEVAPVAEEVVEPTIEEQAAEQSEISNESTENNADFIGRSLTSDEAKTVILAMQQNAEQVELMELTPENWIAQFGEDGILATPIGDVKMGENQYFKLAKKGRDGKLGMIKPTLLTPDVIIEEKSTAKDGQVTERDSSYVFVKAFTNDDGSRNYLFTSVTIRKEGKEVVISNQEKETPRIERLLKEGKLAYISKATLPSEPTNSTQGNQSTILGGAILSESKDTTTEPITQEVAQENLQPTPENAAEEQMEVPQQYTITPAQYTNKRGNVLDMHLVKFSDDLSKEQQKAAKQLAKENRGWWDKDKGGFMMRSEESAKELADTILNNAEAVSDAQPVSLEQMREVGSATNDVVETQPAPQSNEPKWKYELTVYENGRTILERSQIMPNGSPISDGHFEVKADSPRDMLGILSNPNNGLESALEQIGTRLNERADVFDFREKARTEGVNGFKIGDNIIYTENGKREKGTIHDFNDYGDHAPVLDLGAAPVLYVQAQWDQVEKDDVTHRQFVQIMDFFGKDLTNADGRVLRIVEVAGAEKMVRFHITETNGNREEFTMPYTSFVEILDSGQWKKPVAEAMTATETKPKTKKKASVKPKQVNVEGLLGELNRKGEAKLSDHIVEEQTNPSGNKLVTDERYEELKRKMRQKLLGQMNMGIDPEILAIGTEMAVYHIEKGARKFADYAKGMIADLGDVIRPYLKAFYNGARELPEVERAGFADEMTPYDEVRTFDVANFDKAAPNAMATAETAVKEQEVEQQAEVATEKIKNNRNKARKSAKKSVTSQQEVDNSQDTAEQKQKTTDNELQRDDDAVRTEGLPANDNSDTATRSRAGDSKEVQQKSGRADRSGASGSERAGDSVQQRNERSNGRIQRVSEPNNTRNNHSERGEDHAPTSVDARIEANIKAIELAQALIENGESATPAQMAILRKFSGWGGLGKAFTESSWGWRKDAPPTRLRELLGEEAYQQAVMSANSSYYTPAYVIDTLWDIAEKLGFEGGNILEGSAGIGNILGQMPKHISEQSNIQAVEIDETAGNILSLLYPDAKVDIQGFEQTQITNGSVDLAITNVPFVTGLRVNDTTSDRDLSKKFHNIHDFCIAKNVRKLRPGGIGIFITSNGTLDNSKKLRDWVVNEGGADFIGAFRLNNKTFSGTAVTSDIVVIRKRVNGKKSANAIDVSTTSGERTAEYDTGKTRKVKGVDTPIIKELAMDYNRYFMEHPENMAGEMQFGFENGDTYRPTSKGLYPARSKDQGELLNNFVQSFEEEEAVDAETTELREVVDVEPDKKVGEVFVRDGQLFINLTASAQPLGVNANKVKGHTKVECFEAYSAIKDALNNVLEYQQQNEDDKGLKSLLDRLNKAYDDFVETYGYFNKNTAIAFLRNDVDYANVASIETFEEQGDKKGNLVRKYGKADVMKGRVIEKDKEPTPTNIKDGIVASIFKHGRIDIPYIAKQLGQPESEVKTEIIDSGLGFEDPTTLEMTVSYQYLSGNVREKLRQAQENNENGAFDKNIKALEQVIPMNIPAHLIDFTLGSSWIDPKLYDEYVKDRTDIDVKFTAVGGTWFMDAPEWGLNKEKNRSMGVVSQVLQTTIMGHKLIEAAIQNKTITVSTTRKRWDGSTETITDKDATQACAAKIDEIRQDFKEWARNKMQSDSEMSAQMERIYNDTFNNYVPVHIPDEFVPEYFSGAARVLDGKPLQMRPHQGRAIVRGTMQPLMLAHEVGTGKTYTLISTAMEMRRLGTARKPMVVVQNATVGQFVASAKELYPNAKILTLDDADRNAEGRKNFYAKIKYNDWDMIVVPQSTFEFIPDSEERQMAFVQDKIEEKMIILEQMKDDDRNSKSLITRQAEKEIEDLEAQLAELTKVAKEKRTAQDEKKRAVALQNAEVQALEMLDRRTDDVENFDDMGIDALLIDEAHEYKHLGFATAMQRGVKGVDPSYSKKSQGVFLKTQAVLENNNGRNVIFATGTPISNTAAEIWTFMRYLMPADTMKEYGIYYFDDFVRNFGNIQQMLEFTTSGKFKENNRFAGYVNLPELVRIWSGVADTVLTAEAGGVKDKIPEMEGGQAQDLYLPQTRALRGIMKFVKAQLDAFDQMSGKQKKENSHIPLTMYGIAKAAAVDARLVLPNAEDDTNSKTNEAVRQILRSLKETDKYNGTVALFADNYQNKQSGFNLYEDIRSKLITAGIPAEKIAIIKSGMTVKKKLDIFDKVNRGEIRVIMGSTFTLGTGVNIQERLHTLIHLDAPNRPMDYTQRNGRILRQGNLHKDMNKPVRVLRFGVEDSLDVTAYQRLKTKGAIADSIMHGKQMMSDSMTNRVLEEEEDVFGDTVAQLSGSEYAMLKNNAEKNVRKFESRKKQWEADQTYIHNNKPKLIGKIKQAKQRAEDNKKYLESVRTSFPGGTFNDIVVGKNRFENLDAMADFIKDHNKTVLDEMKKMRENPYGSGNQSRQMTVSIGDFDFIITTTIERELGGRGAQLFTEIHRKMAYSCSELGLQDIPVKQGLLRNAIEDITENVITGKDFEENIEYATRSVENNTHELEQLQSREGKPFEYEAELQQAKEQYKEYSELMKKEMAEKEAKYAEIDQTVDTAEGVMDIEEDDDNIRFRSSDRAEVIANFDADFAELDSEYQQLDKNDEQAMAEWRAKKKRIVEDYLNYMTDDLALPASVFVYDHNDKGSLDEAVRLIAEVVADKLGENVEELYLPDHKKDLDEFTDAIAAFTEVGRIINGRGMYNVGRAVDNNKPLSWFGAVAHENTHYLLEGKHTEQEFADIWNEAVENEAPIVSKIQEHYATETNATKGEEVVAFAVGGYAGSKHTHIFASYIKGDGEVSLDDIVKKLNKSLPLRNKLVIEVLNKLRDEYQRQETEVNTDRGDQEANREREAARQGQESSERSPRRDSQATGQPRRDLNAIATAAEELAGQLHTPIRIIGDVSEINDDDLNTRRRKRSYKGWYDVSTGEVVVVAPNATSVADVQRTVIHEVVAHNGLRELFGADFDTFLDNVYRNVNEPIRRAIANLAARKGWDFRVATEEYLASLAETTNFEEIEKQGWWQKIKDYFMDLLRKVGIKLAKPLTNDELRYILWRSYQMQKSKGAMAVAEDVDMQRKLGVGNFRTRQGSANGNAAEDRKYMDAVMRGDMETAQRMVDEAAKAAGYNEKVYHGTQFFGFTKFGSQRPSGAIFTSDKRNVAANYGGGNRYASVRRINQGYKGGRTSEEVISDARSVFDQEWRMVNDKERSVVIDKIEADAKRVMQKMNSLQIDVPTEIQENVAWVENIIYTTAEGRENGNNGDEMQRMLLDDYEQFVENRSALREWLGDHRSELTMQQQQYLDYLIGYEVFDVAVDAGHSFANAFSSDEMATVDGLHFVPIRKLWEETRKAANVGSYELYGNLGDRPLIINGEGKAWYGLDFNGMRSTDDIAEWAKQEGYTSVVFNNISDNGDPSDVKVFFNPEQVKSADPVTYDDNGNVIPLSERFNNRESDIRFREGSPTTPTEYERTLARDAYESRVKKGMFQSQEALQDSMLSLKVAMETIMGKDVYIEDIAGYENAYLGENRLSSVNQAEAEAFANTIFKPMLDEVAKLAKNEDQRERLIDYMMAKHGLERNKVMAERDAKAFVKPQIDELQKALEKKGITDAEAKKINEKIDLLNAEVKGVRKSLPLDVAQKWYGTKIDTLDTLLRNGEIDDKTYEERRKRIDTIYNDGYIGIYRRRDYAGLTALTGIDKVAEAERSAQQIIDNYEAGRDVAPLWEKVNAANKAILQKSRESGMISGATFEDISNMYQYYIPLRGFDEKTSAEEYAYLAQRQGEFNAPIRKAKGRSSKADDPFANMQSMAESAIMQGNRNQLVKQRFLNFALNHPSDLVSVSELWLKYNETDGVWEPALPEISESDTPAEIERKMSEFEAKMKELAADKPDKYKKGKDAVNIPYRVANKNDLRQHQVIVKRGGRDYVMTINGNPRLAQALNGLTNPDNDFSGSIGAILKQAEYLNRLLSKAYTTSNPDFIVSNFVRDMLYTNTMVWIKEQPNYALRYHANYLKVNPVMMKVLYAKYRKGTLDMSNKTEAMFSQFIKNGGETGYVNIRNIEQHKADIDKELRKANGKITPARAWDFLGERFDEYNSSVENCARFAAFVTSREMGRSIDRAIYDAKEISVNFNKKGSGSKFLGTEGMTKLGNASAFTSGIGRTFYVFWNAAIQGTTNFGRQVKRHPAKAFTAGATMFLLGALIAALGNDDDDDTQNSYYNLPEYVRRSNILFRAGNESWISIPLPVEYRAIYGLGELMVSTLSGKEHLNSGELATAIAGQVSQILPIDFMEGKGGFGTLIPSAVKPIVEMSTNTSWTGLPIYKDTPYNQTKPDWIKAYKSANKHIVNLTKNLNEATGGDAHTKGKIDINPAKVEHFLNGYFGGYFNTIDKMTKMAETIAGDREYEHRNMLFINRLVKSGDERTEARAINNEYQRLKKEYGVIKERLRGYENDTEKGIFDYAEKIDFLNHSPEYARYQIFDSFREEIEDLDKELKEANENEDEAEIKNIEAELVAKKKELINKVNLIRGRK